MNKFTLITLLFLTFFMSGLLSYPRLTKADSVTASVAPNVSLFYCWNGSIFFNGPADCTTTSAGGWTQGLVNPNITIKYSATIYNSDTGQYISNSDQVPVGTHLVLSTTPHDSSDIYWFGSGYGVDSPYGDWVAGAATPVYPPVCDSKDAVNSDGSHFDPHIPLEIDPPSGKKITTSANLTCSTPSTDSNQTISENCTINAAGSVAAKFDIPTTYGKFYYRYVAGAGICHGNNAALRTVSSTYVGNYSELEATSPFTNSVNSNDYKVSVPPQSISFSFSAVPANGAPNKPTITGTATYTNTSYPFTFSNSQDPDGDTLRYEIDWDNSGAPDGYLPTSGYAAGKPSLSTNHQWATPGTYTFKARAADVNGNLSGWTTASVTVSNQPAPPTALLTASPATIGTGKSSTLTYTCTNGTSASIDQGIGAVSPAANGTKTVSPAATITYTLTCTNVSGTDTDTTTVTVGDPDLTAGNTSSSAYNPATGAYFTAGISEPLAGTVTNAGTASANSFANIFQYTSDYTTYYTTSAGTLTLAPGASSGVTGATAFPSAGTWHVRTCADYNTSYGTTIAESNEGNNCGAWFDVQVAPPTPTGLTASCNANGTQATLSWNPSAGASFYYVRVNPSNGSCPSNWQIAPWDTTTCIPNPDHVTSSSITFGAVPGQAYSWWVHGALSTGEWDVPGSSSFTCNGVPNLTITAAPTGSNSFAANVSPTFNASVLNNGTAVATTYPNIIQVLDSTGTTNVARYAATPATVTTNANASSAIAGSIPANTLSAGTYQVRFCANMNTSGTQIITEGNYADDCSPAMPITVTSVTPPATACTVSPSSLPASGGTVTYNANPSSGASSPYTWTPSDGVGSYGSNSTATRTFTAAQAGSSYGMAVQASQGASTLSNCPAISVGVVCSGTPTGTLTANPNRIRANTSTSITFALPNIQNVKTSCTLSGPGMATPPAPFNPNSCTVSGSFTTNITIATQSTYTLTCDGLKTATAIINVLPNFQEF